MSKKYFGKIKYTVDAKHPDRPCIKGWTKNKVFEFSDIYTFTDIFYDDEEEINYIKNDLRLIAGGGYDTKHIHNVSFEIKRI